MIQLDPPLHVQTPLGAGYAHFLWTDGDECEWQVFINSTGESWWFRNPYIRKSASVTAEIGPTTPIACPAGLEPHVQRYKNAGLL